MKPMDENEFPPELERILGALQEWEEPAPGVYYFSVKDSGEYYAVHKGSGSISMEAKAYGRSLADCPDWLLYPFTEDRSGWRIIQYELLWKQTDSKPPEDGYSPLLDAALFAAEYHPEYFGAYPVPRHTPSGVMTRYQALANGIYWLDTDRRARFLAVCFPIWSTELDTDFLRHLGMQSEYDLQHGIERTYGYMFYTERICCVPLYVLLRTRKAWETTGIIDKSALMNAIWENCPEYAASNNAREQSGLNDGFAQLVNAFGVPAEAAIDSENMIVLTPGAGTDFLHMDKRPMQIIW